MSGFVLFMGQGAVMWTSRKQPIVTVSTGESEYVGLTPASKNMIWLHKILSELSTFIANPSIYPTEPTILYSDSQNALSIAKDSVFHERTSILESVTISLGKPLRKATSDCNTAQPMT